MVKELDTSCVTDFTARIHKAMTRATHNGLTVGFEWEIPYRSGDYTDTPRGHQLFGEDWAHSYGFNTHNDSGGREMGSPIFNNISTARRFAMWLQEAAEEAQFLTTDNSVGNCGIHVHTSDNEMVGRDDSLDQPPSCRSTILWAVTNLVLNRQENAVWLPEWSGRRINQSYFRQCQPTCWDGRDFNNYIPYNLGMVKFNLNAAQQRGASAYMPQGAEYPVTIEFRIWSSHTNRLLPAIEFGHSFFRWMRKWVESHEADWSSILPRSYNSSSNPPNYRVLNDMLPHMSEYFQWLDGTKGYKNLKSSLEGVAVPA